MVPTTQTARSVQEESNMCRLSDGAPTDVPGDGGRLRGNTVNTQLVAVRDQKGL